MSMDRDDARDEAYTRTDQGPPWKLIALLVRVFRRRLTAPRRSA